MIRSRFTLLLCSLVSILVATSALAYTSAELVTWEQALHAKFNSVEADVLNCPNGACQARSVIEAAYAAALGVKLGGVNRYGDEAEDRGTLGDGRAPMAADIRAAVSLRRQTTMLLAGAAAAIGLLRLARRR